MQRGSGGGNPVRPVYLDVVRSNHPLTAFLGPCLTERAAARRLNIPLDDLHRYATAGTVVRVVTPDGTSLYPEWALDGDDVRGDVMYAFAFTGHLSDPTGLTFATWMLCPSPALDGDTPLQWIDRGKTEDEGRLQEWAALSARTYAAQAVAAPKD